MNFKACLAVLACTFAQPVLAQTCADGKTLTEGTLTIGTGNPSYFPWVHNDAPESGEGFEAAVAYEIASRMGFDQKAVVWIRTSFDQAIQPGDKNFDFNLQQFSIRPERKEFIDFSDPYYESSLAIVVRPDVAERMGGDTSAEAIRGLKFGGASGQTSSMFVEQQIKPTSSTLLYDDLSDVVAALNANQIEAAVFETPTALFVTAVHYSKGHVLGAITPPEGWGGDRFGLVFTKGNPLSECANEAIASMKVDGTLDKLSDAWINTAANIPVLTLED